MSDTPKVTAWVKPASVTACAALAVVVAVTAPVTSDRTALLVDARLAAVSLTAAMLRLDAPAVVSAVACATVAAPVAMTVVPVRSDSTVCRLAAVSVTWVNVTVG